MFFQICFGLILCFHFHFVPVDAVLKSSEYVRWKRAINDEAQQGKCLAFQDIKGRNGQAVEYVCCNNCFDADESCRGTTYVGGSTLYYCTRCGSNTLNSPKLFESFSCGGCNGQTRSKNTCKVQYSSVPDGCWLFRACFESECKKKKPGYSAGTCFNGHCEDDENVNNCPADCCPVRNPKNCTLKDGVCPLKCCGDSSCCKTSSSSSGKENTALTVLKYIGLAVALVVFGVVGELLRRKYNEWCGNNQVHPTETSSTDSDADLCCLACLCAMCFGCD